MVTLNTPYDCLSYASPTSYIVGTYWHNVIQFHAAYLRSIIATSSNDTANLGRPVAMQIVELFRVLIRE